MNKKIATPTFSSITSQRGSIGYEIVRTNLLQKMHEASTNSLLTPIDVVKKNLQRKNISEAAYKKFREYQANIKKMNWAAAIKYTANFCKKGCATYIPTNSFLTTK